MSVRPQGRHSRVTALLPPSLLLYCCVARVSNPVGMQPSLAKLHMADLQPPQPALPKHDQSSLMFVGDQLGRRALGKRRCSTSHRQ